jgi:putative nucleotidyltransferase with HDIG domain
MDTEPHYIHPDQICIGLYIHLDTGWMGHSFTFSNFEIKNKEQIQKIQALNLKQIRYDPSRSKCKPLPAAAPQPAAVPSLAQPSPIPASPAPTAVKAETKKFKLRADRLMQLNKLILDGKKNFTEDAKVTREVVLNFALNPQDSRVKAETMVNSLVNSVITESGVVLHAVSSNKSDPEVYVHSLNVAVLALMLAKTLDMSEQEARELGIAAILHDVGKNEEYQNKKSMSEQHCEIGARMAQESGLSERVAKIILQHHECADGSGHPRRLVADEIDPLARLLAIVNVYDNLCNPGNPAERAMSPYEALAHMYHDTPKKFDARLLQFFIRSLGVYPPGSIVQLSNGVYGIVMTANPNTPLLPFVMVYAPNVPRKTLVVIDLSEEVGVTISKCLKPKQLPQEVFDYFSPRNRVSYYFLKQSLPEAPDVGLTNKTDSTSQSRSAPITPVA